MLSEPFRSLTASSKADVTRPSPRYLFTWVRSHLGSWEEKWQGGHTKPHKNRSQLLPALICRRRRSNLNFKRSIIFFCTRSQMDITLLYMPHDK